MRLVTADAIRRLFSPESGRTGQAARFVVAGGFVMVVYVVLTTLLSQVLGAPFQLALIIGYLCAVIVHFTLQRVFVWRSHEEFALRLHQQMGRYALVAGSQYGVTAVATAVLPNALGVPTEIVYLATVLLVTVANFLVLGGRVFHRTNASHGQGAIS